MRVPSAIFLTRNRKIRLSCPLLHLLNSAITRVCTSVSTIRGPKFFSNFSSDSRQPNSGHVYADLKWIVYFENRLLFKSGVLKRGMLYSTGRPSTKTVPGGTAEKSAAGANRVSVFVDRSASGTDFLERRSGVGRVAVVSCTRMCNVSAYNVYTHDNTIIHRRGRTLGHFTGRWTHACRHFSPGTRRVAVTHCTWVQYYLLCMYICVYIFMVKYGINTFGHTSVRTVLHSDGRA